MEKIQDLLIVRRKASGGALSYVAACLGYLASVGSMRVWGLGPLSECGLCTCVHHIHLDEIMTKANIFPVILPFFYFMLFSLLLPAGQIFIPLSLSALTFVFKVRCRRFAFLHPQGH